jgi:hypothetical protein
MGPTAVLRIQSTRHGNTSALHLLDLRWLDWDMDAFDYIQVEGRRFLGGKSALTCGRQPLKPLTDRKAIDAHCAAHRIPNNHTLKKKQAVVFCPNTVYRDNDGQFRYASKP